MDILSYIGWVKAYYVSYSQDDSNWVEIAKVFDGNFGQDSTISNDLPAYTSARFFSLRTVDGYRTFGLRFDLKGCKIPSKLARHRKLISGKDMNKTA